MNKLRGLVMFAALGFGALAGCGSVEESAAPELDSVEQDLKYCRSNSDCLPNQGCINSACRPVLEDGIPCGKYDPSTGDIPSTTYCNPPQICCLNTGTCANSSAGCGI